MTFRVCSTRTRLTEDGWQRVTQVPTFELEASSLREAESKAQEIVGPDTHVFVVEV